MPHTQARSFGRLQVPRLAAAMAGWRGAAKPAHPRPRSPRGVSSSHGPSPSTLHLGLALVGLRLRLRGHHRRCGRRHDDRYDDHDRHDHDDQHDDHHWHDQHDHDDHRSRWRTDQLSRRSVDLPAGLRLRVRWAGRAARVRVRGPVQWRSRLHRSRATSLLRRCLLRRLPVLLRLIAGPGCGEPGHAAPSLLRPRSASKSRYAALRPVT